MGLDQLLLPDVHDNKSGDGGVETAEETKKEKTCGACAGFGCSWCDGSNVAFWGGGVQERKKQDELLWEAVFCPPVQVV